MTNRGRLAKVLVERKADVAQAKVFHRLLTEHRAELCDRLDAHATRLARYERRGDSLRSQRKRQHIKEIGAEIRDIDRMMQGLSRRLLGV